VLLQTAKESQRVSQQAHTKQQATKIYNNFFLTLSFSRFSLQCQSNNKKRIEYTFYFIISRNSRRKSDAATNTSSRTCQSFAQNLLVYGAFDKNFSSSFLIGDHPPLPLVTT